MEQRPLVIPRGENRGTGSEDERVEAMFTYSSEEEVKNDVGCGDCGSTMRGRGSARRSGETRESVISRHASPLSSRRSSRSTMSSRSSSPAVSAQTPRSNSPTFRPGSPMSQGSGCGSMAPMYSPIALTETDCMTNAASLDGVDRELDRDVTGGVSANVNTNSDVGADAEANAVADAGSGDEEGAAEAIEGPCCIQDGHDGRGSFVHQGGEVSTTSYEVVDIKSGRIAVNGDNRDANIGSSPAASQSRARSAAGDAPSGDNIKAGSVPELHKAEAKQQRFESGNASKRRGEGRSRSRSPRRRKKTAVENSGRIKEACSDVPRSTTASGSPRECKNVSASSPRSGWGRQDEREESPPRSEPGSPHESHRRRRNGKGKRHNSGNSGGINNDSKPNPAPRTGSTPASKTEENGAGGISGYGAGARSTRAREDCGAQQHSGEERVVAAEGKATPDPMEAGRMLQKLSSLSTTLRRLSCGGNGAFGAAIPNKVSPPAAGKKGGIRKSKGVPPSRCERCLVLAEKLEDLRERARLQQRLLEHSDKLLGVATVTTMKQQDTRPRPAGQRDDSKISSPATVSDVGNDGRAGLRDATVMHEEDEDCRRDEHQSSRIAQQDPRKSGGRDAGPSAAETAAAESAAEVAAAAEEENEALLAAAEEVWRFSEKARDVLEGELERKQEALATTVKTAREFKERSAEQVPSLCLSAQTSRPPAVHRRQSYLS